MNYESESYLGFIKSIDHYLKDKLGRKSYVEGIQNMKKD